MKAFNLKEALAGQKVVTRDGQEVTQVVLFKPVKDGCESICALVNGRIYEFYEDGNYIEGAGSSKDLFMTPKKLSGFLNTYTIHAPTWHSTKEDAGMDFYEYGDKRIACIDLSQFEEGHGL
jgi:hypothetical protein